MDQDIIEELPHTPIPVKLIAPKKKGGLPVPQDTHDILTGGTRLSSYVDGIVISKHGSQFKIM
jgi:hypothetical protein